MRNFWIRVLIRLAIPMGAGWIRQQEARVLHDGRPLSEWESGWAVEVGVRHPERVRILLVPVVPTPGSSLLRVLAAISRFGMDAPTGMAVNYGIFLDSSQSNNPSLLVHELAHVAQYERLRGIEAFLAEYLRQCVADGYWDADMEQEARDAAAPYARPPGG